jgi:hypothetical protein
MPATVDRADIEAAMPLRRDVFRAVALAPAILANRAQAEVDSRPVLRVAVPAPLQGFPGLQP